MQKSILLPEDQYLSLQRQLQRLKSLTGTAKTDDLQSKYGNNTTAATFEHLPSTNHFTDGYIRQRVDSELAKYLELVKKPIPPLPVSVHQPNQDEIPTLTGFRQEVLEENDKPRRVLSKKKKKKIGVKRVWKETVKRGRKEIAKKALNKPAFSGWVPLHTPKTPQTAGDFFSPPPRSSGTSLSSKTPTSVGGFVYDFKTPFFPSTNDPPSVTTPDKFPYNNFTVRSKRLWKHF